MRKSNAAAFESFADAVQQFIVVERLGQELQSTSLHRLHCRWHITLSGDADDWHIGAFDGNPLLQLEAMEFCNRNVKYQAARDLGSWTIQEFLRGRECLGLPTLASN